MSRYIVVFLLVAFVGSIGYFAKANDAVSNEDPSSPSLVASVQCYSCVGCSKVEKETYNKFCSHSPDPVKIRTCVKYGEIYPHSNNGKNNTLVVRGCASERGSCEDIKKAFEENNPFKIKLAFCTECQGDLCNSVSRTLPGLFLAFFAVVLTPVFAKYTLS